MTNPCVTVTVGSNLPAASADQKLVGGYLQGLFQITRCEILPTNPRPVEESAAQVRGRGLLFYEYVYE